MRVSFPSSKPRYFQPISLGNITIHKTHPAPFSWKCCEDTENASNIIQLEILQRYRKRILHHSVGNVAKIQKTHPTSFNFANID